MLQFCSNNIAWIALVPLLKTKKKTFAGRKNKNEKLHQQKVQTDTPTKLFFQIFKIEFCCYFWFSIKQKIFLNYKLTFVLPQKILGQYHKYSINNFFSSNVLQAFEIYTMVYFFQN